MASSTVRRAALTGLVAVVCLLAAAACAKPADRTGTPGLPGATTAPGTGSIGDGGGGSTPTGGTPPTTAAPTYPADAETYAKQGVAAWVGGDSARLDQLEAAGATLHTLAACHGCYDLHFTLVGPCDGAMGSSYCLFYNKVGDSLRIHLSNPLLGHPHAIVAGSIWDPISFPSDNKAYATEALQAWQGGNDARLKLLTNNMTSAQVTALGANRAADWTFDHADGAMGSIYETFTDSAGHQLAFRFVNGPAAPTTGPASQHRITEIVLMAA